MAATQNVVSFLDICKTIYAFSLLVSLAFDEGAVTTLYKVYHTKQLFSETYNSFVRMFVI